jgi:hypothetical protein
MLGYVWGWCSERLVVWRSIVVFCCYDMMRELVMLHSEGWYGEIGGCVGLLERIKYLV